MNKLWWLLPAAAVMGCSSPVDVQQRHDRATEAFSGDMAAAQEWNNHVLGIPASGWLAILLLASLLVFTLLILLGVWVREMQNNTADRRVKLESAKMKAEHDLAVEKEKTRQAALNSARCHVCGADPLVDIPARGTE